MLRWIQHNVLPHHCTQFSSGCRRIWYRSASAIFMFTNLLCQSGNSGQNNFQNSLSNSSVLASDASGTSVITSNNDLTHGTSVITSDNGLSHENTTSATTSSDGFRRKYPHIKRIGTSIHSVEDAVFAESHGADYITAGHIFTTDCKKGFREEVLTGWSQSAMLFLFQCTPSVEFQMQMFPCYTIVIYLDIAWCRRPWNQFYPNNWAFHFKELSLFLTDYLL